MLLQCKMKATNAINYCAQFIIIIENVLVKSWFYNALRINEIDTVHPFHSILCSWGEHYSHMTVNE